MAAAVPMELPGVGSATDDVSGGGGGGGGGGVGTKRTNHPTPTSASQAGVGGRKERGVGEAVPVPEAIPMSTLDTSDDDWVRLATAGGMPQEPAFLLLLLTSTPRLDPLGRR